MDEKNVIGNKNVFHNSVITSSSSSVILCKMKEPPFSAGFVLNAFSLVTMSEASLSICTLISFVFKSVFWGFLMDSPEESSSLIRELSMGREFSISTSTLSIASVFDFASSEEEGDWCIVWFSDDEGFTSETEGWPSLALDESNSTLSGCVVSP